MTEIEPDARAGVRLAVARAATGGERHWGAPKGRPSSRDADAAEASDPASLATPASLAVGRRPEPGGRPILTLARGRWPQTGPRWTAACLCQERRSTIASCRTAEGAMLRVLRCGDSRVPWLVARATGSLIQGKAPDIPGHLRTTNHTRGIPRYPIPGVYPGL